MQILKFCLDVTDGNAGQDLAMWLWNRLFLGSRRQATSCSRVDLMVVVVVVMVMTMLRPLTAIFVESNGPCVPISIQPPCALWTL